MQIDQLSEYMRQGFGEIKSMLTALDERVRAIEHAEAGCYPVMTAKIDAAWREIDKLKTTVDSRGDRISALEHNQRLTSKVLIWLSGGLGTLILGTLWQLLTGGIHLVP
jgi:hypothetical protein